MIGGFHLLDVSEEKVKKTAQYLKSLNVKQLHPCHCTGLSSKIKISEYLNVKDIGVGLSLDYK